MSDSIRPSTSTWRIGRQRPAQSNFGCSPRVIWRNPGRVVRIRTRDARMRFGPTFHKRSRFEYARNVGVLRTVLAAFVIAFAPTAAWAQRVTKVPDGDTLIVQGVGKVHLLGIKSADEPAVHLGPSGPPPQPRPDPSTPTPTAVGGRISLTRDHPSRDFLRKLALGRMVRIEYDPLVESSNDRVAYLFLEDGTLLNAEMLKAGRARLDVTRQFVREQEFKRLEADAQSASVGIWIH